MLISFSKNWEEEMSVKTQKAILILFVSQNNNSHWFPITLEKTNKKLESI